MKKYCPSQWRRAPILVLRRGILTLVGLACFTCTDSKAQSPADDTLGKQVQQLTEALARTQAQVQESQRTLEEMRTQLAALQHQLAERDASSVSGSTAQLSAAVDEIREQQALQANQIATHEQSKIESESKYAVKLSGLVLLSGFVNTRQVDLPTTPSVVTPGPGSTGATLRQTVLGLDARGPHLLGASSYADVRVDFDGANLANSSSANSAYGGGILRLRTAHASLAWKRTEAFFSLDRPIIVPNTPSSLTAVAIPALAWSGNLWTWNPQLGVTQDIPLSAMTRFRAQAALIDIADPPSVYTVNPSAGASDATLPPTSEQSRWPGVESRLALSRLTSGNGLEMGVGGLYAPHHSLDGTRFDSWAATLDYRLPLEKHTELSGSFYRGTALGGLGAGTFKDYVYYVSQYNPEVVFSRALDDVGGWAQFKIHAGEHFESNFAFGTDQVFAGQLRPYAGASTASYLNLARNRTYTGNVIFSPSAYLLFSLEYRHLQSSPVNGATATGDVIGIATGYRF